MQLLIDGNRGIYIPQDFVTQYRRKVLNAEELGEDLDTCERGPDEEFYWDSWDNILTFAVIKFGKDKYFLHQDQDLFIVGIDEKISEDGKEEE